MLDNEFVRAVYTKPDGVYIDCKYTDATTPYRLRKSERLTNAYERGGQKGLDVELVQMFFWRFGIIKGNHPSVARFLPCMEKANKIYSIAKTEVNNKYSELALNGEMLGVPDDKLSDEAKAYQKFHDKTIKNAFERIAELAEPIPQAKKRDAGAR